MFDRRFVLACFVFPSPSLKSTAVHLSVLGDRIRPANGVTSENVYLQRPLGQVDRSILDGRQDQSCARGLPYLSRTHSEALTSLPPLIGCPAALSSICAGTIRGLLGTPLIMMFAVITKKDLLADSGCLALKVRNRCGLFSRRDGEQRVVDGASDLTGVYLGCTSLESPPRRR